VHRVIGAFHIEAKPLVRTLLWFHNGDVCLFVLAGTERREINGNASLTLCEIHCHQDICGVEWES